MESRFEPQRVGEAGERSIFCAALCDLSLDLCFLQMLPTEQRRQCDQCAGALCVSLDELNALERRLWLNQVVCAQLGLSCRWIGTATDPIKDADSALVLSDLQRFNVECDAVAILQSGSMPVSVSTICGSGTNGVLQVSVMAVLSAVYNHEQGHWFTNDHPLERSSRADVRSLPELVAHTAHDRSAAMGPFRDAQHGQCVAHDARRS